jgi:hypothetical protein
MSNNELDWFQKEASKSYQHASSDLLTSEALNEMLASSLDIGLILNGLPAETIQKLRDCYIDMISEVRERLQDLYGNILIKLHSLQYVSHRKSNSSLDYYRDYSNHITLSKSHSLMQKYNSSVHGNEIHFHIN